MRTVRLFDARDPIELFCNRKIDYGIVFPMITNLRGRFDC